MHLGNDCMNKYDAQFLKSVINYINLWIKFRYGNVPLKKKGLLSCKYNPL